MKKNIPMLFAALAVAVLFIYNSQPVLAQSSAGIKISPVRIEEMVDPGEIFRGEVKVTNESDSPKTFYVYLRDFRSEGEAGSARLIAPGSEEGNFLASWISVTSEGIDLAPGGEAAVPFTVSVPANVGPGGYFGAIVFGTEPPRLQLEGEEKGAGMAIAQQTASLILLRVKGDAIEEAQIREFNTDKNFYSTPFAVDFLLRIENTGNVHIKPYGAISIKNMFGKEAAIVKVNEKGGNVLPKSIRRFDKNIWEGKYAFGRYTATLGVTYGISVDEGGQGKNSLVAEKTFWIIPWRIILPVFIILLFVSGLFWLFMRLYKNKAVRQAMERAGIPQSRYSRNYQKIQRPGNPQSLHFFVILAVVFAFVFIFLLGFYFLFFA